MFLELTSPAEENIQTWKKTKREKYTGLVDQAKSNGWNAICRTIEVGARGFVSASSMSVSSLLGLPRNKIDKVRRDMSKTAIRASHFIWISRENQTWSHPARICNG